MFAAALASIRGAWDFLLHLAATAPLGLWAVVLGLLGSMATTYAVKRWVVLRLLTASWSKDAKQAGSQTLAFAAGVGWTWAFWRSTEGLLVGILVGLLAPLFWAGFCAFALFFIGLKWPALRARLEGHT